MSSKDFSNKWNVSGVMRLELLVFPEHFYTSAVCCYGIFTLLN